MSEGVYGNSELDVGHFQVDLEEIENREGNFIITVGNVGSGKSTIQHHLVANLWDHDHVTVDWNSHNDNPTHDLFLNEWIKHFKETRVLPKRTQANLFQEFNVRITQSSRKPFELNFLEISGEDIQEILPSLRVSEIDEQGETKREFTDPHLKEEIDAYLQNDKIRKRFLFVSDVSVNPKTEKVTPSGNPLEDTLFHALLRYVIESDEIDIRRVEILFVAAKWDLLDKSYKNDERLYFHHNFKNTLAYIREKSAEKNIKVSYTPYSIGKVEQVQSGNVTLARVKSEIETHYIDLITHWILQSFTNQEWRGFPPITLNWWQKVKRFFAW